MERTPSISYEPICTPLLTVLRVSNVVRGDMLAKAVCWVLGRLRGDPALGHDTMPSGAGLGLCKRCDTLVPLNATIRKVGRAFEKRRDRTPISRGR